MEIRLSPQIQTSNLPFAGETLRRGYRQAQISEMSLAISR